MKTLFWFILFLLQARIGIESTKNIPGHFHQKQVFISELKAKCYFALTQENGCMRPSLETQLLGALEHRKDKGVSMFLYHLNTTK